MYFQRQRELQNLKKFTTYETAQEDEVLEEEGRRNLLPLALALTGLPLFFYGVKIGIFGVIFFGYVGIVLYYKQQGKRVDEDRIKHELPIFIESLILLVESGLGILPAISKTIESRRACKTDGYIDEIFSEVYRLVEKGLPLQKAFQIVAADTELLPLKHTLLHIDISSTTGGELTPALRALSEYTFMEWKHSVESRIKKLENLVVFPVFCSVIGLMFLIAAVPLMPILDLKGTIGSGTLNQGVNVITVEQQ